MTTANDLIVPAMRRIGVLAAGETLDAADANDALEALNTMIDSWSAERLSVFSTQDQTFTWPANTKVRSLGPTGNFVGLRPIQLDDNTYYTTTTSGGVLSLTPNILNQDQYNQIALKNTTSTYPQYIFVNYEMADVEMTVWPVPTVALEWHFISVAELTQPALLATTLYIPPGYRRAFSFNLSCEIAAEYGIEPPPRVSRIADVSKKVIKRINNPKDIMGMPYALVARRRGAFNIYTGGY